MTTGKTAFVFGASGLVGKNLTKQLLDNPNYEKVVLVLRKPLVIINPKALEISADKFIDYDFSEIKPENVHVYCCIGTTIKKAGTKEEFRKVDYDLPLKIANWAKEKEIETFVVISSIGAQAGSGNFYLKTKGEMESALLAVGISRLFIVRPSFLKGLRNEFRLTDEIINIFSGLMNRALYGSFKKYRAIDANKVAKAMIVLANSQEKEGIFESDKLEEIANNGSL
jgi:uncharacterized protein YbjT (DUF2867 family)